MKAHARARRDQASGGQRQTCATKERLLRLWESGIIGMIHGDENGALYDANDAVLQMLGYTRDDLHEGRLNWRSLTPADCLPRDEQGLVEVRARGVCAPYEKAFIARDGRRVPVLIGCALLEGSRTQHICFVQDLTQQKRAEAALADQVTRTITDSTTAALFMLDERGVCTFANPAAEAMVGWSLADLSRRTLHEIIHHHTPDGQPLPVEACVMHRLLSTGGSRLEPSEEVFFRRNGEPFPVVCTARHIERPGRPAAMLLEVRDVTEQKRFLAEREALLESERAARTEAERANRTKDEFVATLSHELRTPLNAVVGWAELARRPGLSPEKVDRALVVIDRNAHALAQIIADLIDVSRISTGKLRIELTPVDVVGVVVAALDALRADADAKHVALTATMNLPAAVVAGDAARLQQVVWNIVSNAIKFTPAGGRVDVALDAGVAGGAASIRLSVKDTGQGIDPTFLPRLFERFRQADASISRRHGGLGLGLSLVKHLVEVHGGTVRGESAGVGKGALFTVELPRAGEPPGAAAPEPPSDRPPALQGARILVVEDEADAREMVVRLLEEQGADVRAAASAAEALALLADRPFDALVSDIGMPGMDGYDLIRRVRAVTPERAMPAVALTAYARPEDRARALAAGFQVHLTKPVEPSELLAEVAALLEHHRAGAPPRPAPPPTTARTAPGAAVG
jgi:PAS domain S-box-containing protein